MRNSCFTAYDAEGNSYMFEESKTERGILLTLKKEQIKEIRDLYALGDFTLAQTGEEGWYVIPRNGKQSGDILTEFGVREDCIYDHKNPIMAVIGLKKKDLCCLIRIERSYLFHIRVEVKEGSYRLSVVYHLEEDYIDQRIGLPKDIRVEVIFLDPSADINDMARMERTIRLERGEITPLREKCKREAVEYARQFPLVRIRNAWKPSPPSVLSQTPENEPPLHVACTFQRVRELADEMKRQGIDGAEIQLVGWNIKGHDGRWPQAFPVEKELGGDAELIATVKHLKNLGYRISLHDNTLDSYEIADSFSWENLSKNEKGEYRTSGDWSGGHSLRVCPTKQIANSREKVEKMRALGVNGIHYVDVLSIVNPTSCHHETHPLCYGEALRTTVEVMRYMKNEFGAFSSEGAMDFALNEIDYGLYVSFGSSFGDALPMIADRLVYMFEVTYHGFLLYNPLSMTVNYPIKGAAERLTLIMRGGKPSIYYYSKFRTSKVNWMGEVDFTCDGEEELKKGVSLIRSALEDYKPLCHLQTEYMERYDVLGEGLEMATYSDGTRLIGNFSEEAKQFEDKTIEPYGYVIAK